MLSMVSSSLVICHYYSFTTLLPQLVEPYGFDDSGFDSTMGILYNFCGVGGGILASILLFYNPRNLSEASLFAATATLATFVYFMLGTAHFDDKVQILIACCVSGFGTLPILMVAYELAVEQTSHLGIGEGMSCGLINSLANFLGFIYVLVLTPFLDNKTSSAALSSMIMLSVSLGLAIVLIIISSFVKIHNRKTNS